MPLFKFTFKIKFRLAHTYKITSDNIHLTSRKILVYDVFLKLEFVDQKVITKNLYQVSFLLVVYKNATFSVALLFDITVFVFK